MEEKKHKDFHENVSNDRNKEHKPMQKPPSKDAQSLQHFGENHIEIHKKVKL